MLTYAIKRISLALIIIVVVMLAMYAMVFLVPGDPASLALGPRATPELRQALIERMGLDRPVYVQVWNFFRNAITGDLGCREVCQTAVSKNANNAIANITIQVAQRVRRPMRWVSTEGCWATTDGPAILPPIL